jgi:hypothetical protein
MEPGQEHWIVAVLFDQPALAFFVAWIKYPSLAWVREGVANTRTEIPLGN